MFEAINEKIHNNLELQERIERLAERFYPRVVELRRQIHRNPELAFEEENTSALVREELQKLNIPFIYPVAKTGVLGILKCNDPDASCIALRADMDALPITEKNDCDYKSTVAGKMHACGHDAHTATLLGVAMILNELKNELKGTVKFIFQPSEEKIPSGAQQMIAEGVLENPNVEAIFGWHVHPEMEVGEVGFKSGKFMASSDELHLTIKGKGGHAAQPANFISPLTIASKVILELQEQTDLGKPRVLTFGKITANGATNIVPETAELQGTLRCFDENDRKRAHQLIRHALDQITQEHGASYDLNILQGYPVVMNDEELTERCKDWAETLSVVNRVYDLPVRMGAEDFGYYTQQVPASFYRVGVGNKAEGITSPIHSSTFNIDERALKVSTSLMSLFAVEYLVKG